mgnify:CR=1 FL=1
MKKTIILIAASVLLCCDSQDMGKEIGKEYGEVINSKPAKDVAKGITDASQGALYTILCENEESTFSDSAQCYMTPTGKRVWELEGKDREHWMKVAIEHQSIQTQRKKEMKLKEKGPGQRSTHCIAVFGKTKLQATEKTSK